MEEEINISHSYGISAIIPSFAQKAVNKVKDAFGRLFAVQTEEEQSEKEEVERTCPEHTCLKVDHTVSMGTPKQNPQLDIGNNSIIYNKATGKYVLISEAPPIRNLVISGGGAKGVILPGVIRAFEERGAEEELSFRDKLDNIAGSSVGAITAALMAAGISSEDLISALENQNFKALLGHGKGPVLKDGAPLTDFIRKHLAATISSHLEDLLGEDFAALEVEQLKEHVREILTDADEEQIEKIAVSLESLLATLQEDKPVITFSMLHALHELDPATFKDLTVTATSRETGTTFYFDAEKTPNLDITLAARASASLPVFLLPVAIDRASLSPGYEEVLGDRDALTFADGGYLDNIPVGAMENKQGAGTSHRGVEGQNLQTLALVFDETGTDPANEQSPFLEVKVKKHALYNSTKWKERVLRDIFGKVFGRIATTERNTVRKEEGLERIRKDYTQRNIPLAVSIKTSDFKKAQRLQDEYIEKGYQQGIFFLQSHKDELMAKDFDSLDALLDHFGEEEEAIDEGALEEFKQSIKDLGVIQREE